MLTHLKFFVFSCKNKKLEDIMQKALNFVEKASKRVCWLNCDGRTLFICIKRSRPRIYKDQGVILGGKLTFRLHLRKIIFSSKSIKTMHALRITTINAFYILHLHCKEISKMLEFTNRRRICHECKTFMNFFRKSHSENT